MRLARKCSLGGLMSGLLVLAVLPAPVMADKAGEGLHVGDVVARGALAGGAACSFVGTPELEQEPGEWVALTLSADCRATVTALWDGTLRDGPPNLAAIAEKIDVDTGAIKADSEPVAAAATVCKTAKELFFTYGGGGAAFDKLTYLWSSLTYCYTDTWVWGTSTSGSGCAGSDHGSWSWVVDWCLIPSQRLTQSTSSVWNQTRGDYHCTPSANFPCNLSNPDGYFHRLWDQVTAYPSGTSRCTHWWDGNVVLGPEAQIISGCV